MKRRTARHETVVRDMTVTSVRACVAVTATRAPSGMPQQEADSHLVIAGELTEPLHDQLRVEMRLYETDAQLGNKEPPAFGVIVAGAGLTRIGAFLRREHWADTWTMATAGAIKHCRISFTMPSRGQGVVTRLALSSHRVED